ADHHHPRRPCHRRHRHEVLGARRRSRDPGDTGRAGVDPEAGVMAAQQLPVQFVGAGPGAADLLTVRAARLLGAAEVVLSPGTYVDAEIFELCSATADLVDTQGLDLDQIVQHLTAAYRAGRAVVRLVSGDPSLYSALFEQTRRLDAAGVRWCVTPG